VQDIQNTCFSFSSKLAVLTTALDDAAFNENLPARAGVTNIPVALTGILDRAYFRLRWIGDESDSRGILSLFHPVGILCVARAGAKKFLRVAQQDQPGGEAEPEIQRHRIIFNRFYPFDQVRLAEIKYRHNTASQCLAENVWGFR